MPQDVSLPSGVPAARIKWYVKSGSLVNERDKLADLCDSSDAVLSVLRSPASGFITLRTPQGGPLPAVLASIESCDHPMMMGGLCGVCGAAVTASFSSSSSVHSSKLTVSGVTVQVSESYAKDFTASHNSRLRSARKLSLVLDLDHTLVHCCVPDDKDLEARLLSGGDSTIRNFLLPHEWSRVEEADLFTARDPKICQDRYFLKMRPFLKEFFLGEAADLYEMSIYTAGNRFYALKTVHAMCRYLVGAPDVDSPPPSCPQEDAACRLRRRLFGDRVVSRTDTADVVALFVPPRAAREFRDELHEEGFGATTYDLKDDILTIRDFPSSRTADLDALVRSFRSRGVERTSAKSLTRIFPCGGSMAVIIDDNANVWDKGNERSFLGNLIECKPYKYKQFERFKDTNNAAGKDLTQLHGGPAPATHDDDDNLAQILRMLKDLHRRFYGRADAVLPAVLKEMREEVFNPPHDGGGRLNLVFSGCIKTEEQESFFASRGSLRSGNRNVLHRFALDLGAAVSSGVTKNITHMISPNAGTEKVIKATKVDGCKVVSVNWLTECYFRCERVSEEPFLLPLRKKGTATNATEDTWAEDSEVIVVSNSSIEELDTANKNSNDSADSGKRKRESEEKEQPLKRVEEKKRILRLDEDDDDDEDVDEEVDFNDFGGRNDGEGKEGDDDVDDEDMIAALEAGMEGED